MCGTPPVEPRGCHCEMANKAQQGQWHCVATSIRPGRDETHPNPFFRVRIMHWILEGSETFFIVDMKMKWHTEASSQLTFVRAYEIFISPTPIQSNLKRCWTEFACCGFPRAAWTDLWPKLYDIKIFTSSRLQLFHTKIQITYQIYFSPSCTCTDTSLWESSLPVIR